MRTFKYTILSIAFGLLFNAANAQVTFLPDAGEPRDSTITSVSNQVITLYLESANYSLIPTFTKLTVDGTQYISSDKNLNQELYLEYDSDTNIATLIFSPDIAGIPPFSNGDTIYFSIDQAENNNGDTLTNPETLFFVVDLDEPTISSPFPEAGTSITPVAFDSITVKITDTAGIIDTSSIELGLTINGISNGIINLTSEYLTWKDSILKYTIDPTLTISDGDSVEVRILARDTIDYGTYHESVFNWGFEISKSGPDVEIILPENLTTTSDTIQKVYMKVKDENGLDSASLKFSFLDSTYTLTSDSLTLLNDTLVFAPDTALKDGSIITYSLDSIDDIYGNPMNDTFLISYTIDRTPPDTLNVFPKPDSVVNDIQQDINIDILDQYSAINTDSILLTVNANQYRVGDPGISWNNTTLIFKPELAIPEVFFDNDVVNITVKAYDKVDYSNSNQMAAKSWSFTIDSAGGPIITDIYPLPGTFSSNTVQPVIIKLSESIYRPSSQLEVNGISYDGINHSAAFTLYNEDSLVFYPDSIPITFSNNQSVEVMTTQILSSNFDNLRNPKEWSFNIDLAPPVFSGQYPVPGDDLALSEIDSISVNISDIFTGVDPDSLKFSLSANGVSLENDIDITDPDLTWNDSILIYTPNDTVFNDGDSVSVRVIACDSVHYGIPNCDTISWSFYINDQSPSISILEPSEKSISGNLSQKIEIEIADSNGIDTNSINLTISSSNYADITFNTLSPEVAYLNNVLTFTPTTAFIGNDTISVSLDSISDVFGRSSDTVSWEWYTDIQSPTITSLYPVLDTNVSIGMLDSVSAVLLDDPYGKINPDSLKFQLRIPGKDSSIYHVVDNNILGINSDSLLLYNYSNDPTVSVNDGDTVEVFISVYDSASYAPNFSSASWTFYINDAPPSISKILPPDSTITSDSLQHINILVEDNNGIDTASIQLSVQINNNTPVNYTIAGSTELSFINDTIKFVPSAKYENGDTLTVSLSPISDVFGTVGADSTWHLFVDLEQPVFKDVYPPSGGGIKSEELDSVSVTILKQIGVPNPKDIKFQILSAGKDTTELLSVDGDRLRIENDTILVYNHFQPDTLFQVSENDTLIARVTLVDSTLFPPATFESLWSFVISENAPEIHFVQPIDSTYSSVLTQQIKFLASDTNGIDYTSVKVRVVTDEYDNTYTFADAALGLSGDTIIFSPLNAGIAFKNGDAVRFAIDSLADNAGMISPDTSLIFYIDKSTPAVEFVYPQIADTIKYAYDSLVIRLVDSISSVADESVLLTVGDRNFAIGDAGVAWNDSILVFNPALADPPLAYINNDTLYISVIASDSLDYGPSNELLSNNTISYFVSFAPIELLSHMPMDSMVTSDSEQEIQLILSANEGIDTSSVRFYINSISYPDSIFTLASDELFLYNDTISFIPKDNQGFKNGEKVSFKLDSLSDIFGNSIFDTLRSFFVDQEIPQAELILPSENITYCYDSLAFIINDSLSGINSSELELSIYGRTFSLPDNSLYLDDSLLVFRPKYAVPQFLFDTGSVEISLLVKDSVDLGDHNQRKYNWKKTAPLEGPRIIEYSPASGVYTSNSYQTISFIIQPDDYDIAVDSIIVSVEGVDYRYNGGAGFVYKDSEFPLADTVVFTPPTPFSSGQEVNVSIKNIFDTNITPGQNPTTFFFIVDTQAPSVFDIRPVTNTVVNDIQQDISFNIVDVHGTIDLDSILLLVEPNQTEDLYYTLDSTSLTWDGSSLVFKPELCNPILTFQDAEYVNYTLTLSDIIDLNGNNEAIVTGYFRIDATDGPIVKIDSIDYFRYISDTLFRIDYYFDVAIEHTLSSIIINDSAHNYVTNTEAWSFDANENRLSYIPSINNNYQDGEVLHVRLNSDIVDRYGNHLQNPQEQKIYIDYSPPVIEAIYPNPAISSDVLIDSIGVVLKDLSGELDLDNLEFGIKFNSSAYDTMYIDDVSLDYIDSVLVYKPEFSFTDGDTLEVWLRVADLIDFGDPHVLDSTWSFIISAGPPEVNILSPSQQMISSDSLQKVVLHIVDINGIDSSTIAIKINDQIFSLSDDPDFFAFENDNLVFTPNVAFADGDRIDLRVYPVKDLFSNASEDIFLTFYVDYGTPPELHIVQPLNSSSSSDTSQVISVHISDPVGIDSTTMQLNIEDRIFDLTSPALSYFRDTLTFNPDSLTDFEYTKNSRINICVQSADTTGKFAQECWSFYLDNTGPSLNDAYPDEGATYNNLFPNITLKIEDEFAAVNPASIELQIEGTTYTIDSSALEWQEPYLKFIAERSGLVFFSGDTVNALLAVVSDTLTYGSSNTSTGLKDWQFYISASDEGPEAIVLSPGKNSVSSDSVQKIVFSINDIDGVKEDSILLQVFDSVYSYNDPTTKPAFSFAGDTVIFDPNLVGLKFKDGEIVNTIIYPAWDQNDNQGSDTIEYSFVVDLSVPQLKDIYPAEGERISEAEPQIKIILLDEYSSIDTTAIKIAINGIVYTIYDDALSYSKDSVLIFDCTEAGLSFGDNDTVNIALESIADNPDIGPANIISDTTWWFRISNIGPDASIIDPPDKVFTSDPTQEVSIYMYDETGIDFASSELLINSNAYALDSSVFTYSEDRLSFSIDQVSASFSDTLNIKLEKLLDIDANPFTDVLEWVIVLDTIKPYASDLIPPANSSVAEASPEISLSIIDSVGSINPQSIRLWINGTGYSIADPFVTWDASNDFLSFSSQSAGLSFIDGDIVTMQITVFDTMNIGEANQISGDTVKWSFGISNGGPSAAFIFPGDSVTISDETAALSISLQDPNGIDLSTIVLSINDVEFNVDDAELTFYEDTDSLIFIPSSALPEGNVLIDLDCNDLFGNSIDADLSKWSFRVDTTKPMAIRPFPAANDSISDLRPPIWVILDDGIGEIDTSSIEFTIYRESLDSTITYDISDPGLTWYASSDSLVFIPGADFSDQELIEVSVSVNDHIDIGPSNVIENNHYMWTFTVLLVGSIDCNISGYQDQPLENVMITISQNGDFVKSLMTEGSGKIMIDVPIGTYKATAVKEGYFSYQNTVNVLENASTLFEAQMGFPGDYNYDNSLSFADLDYLASIWNDSDPMIELGPVQGTIPNVTVLPDGNMDFEDLMVFGLMWNFKNNNKKSLETDYFNLLNMATDEGRQLTLVKSDISDSGNLIYDVMGTDMHNYRSSKLLVKFDTDLLKLERISKGKYFSESSGNDLFLSVIDNENGVIEISQAGLDNPRAKATGVIAKIIFTEKSNSAAPSLEAVFDFRSLKGKRFIGKVEDVSIEELDSYHIRNYPNPFTEGTILEFNLNKSEWVKLRIFDIKGKTTEILINDQLEEGLHQIVWDAQGRSPGVYFCELITLNYTTTIKLVIVDK